MADKQKFFDLVEKIRQKYKDNLESDENLNKQDFYDFMNIEQEIKKLHNTLEEKEKNFQNQNYKKDESPIKQLNISLKNLIIEQTSLEELSFDIIEFPQVETQYHLTINMLKISWFLKKAYKSGFEDKKQLEDFVVSKTTEIKDIIIKYLSEKEIIENIEEVEDKNWNTSFINFSLNSYYSFQQILFQESVINWNTQIGNVWSEKMLFDYSSPNVAKQMSIGHLRSTIIGEVLKNLFEKKWKSIVFGFNYFWDWWEQFGKIFFVLIYCSDEKLNEFKTTFEENDNKALLDIYVYYKTLSEDWEEPQQVAKFLNSMLSQWDKDMLELWQMIKSISLKDFDTIYDRLWISFDSYLWEAFFESFLDELVDDLKSKNLVVEDEEWEKVYLYDKKKKYFFVKPEEVENYKWDENLFKKVLRNNKWVTNYLTRDLATFKFRKQKMWMKYLYYFTWVEQFEHFKILEEISKAAWYLQEWDFFHIWNWLYLKNWKKMSTREGWVNKLSDVFDLVDNILQDKNLSNAAIIVNDLKQQISKDVEFDENELTKSEWDTWVYLLYTAVRWKKIFENNYYKFDINDLDISLLPEIYKDILKEIFKYNYVLENSISWNKLNNIISYVFELAHKLNKAYSGGENISKIEDGSRKKSILALWYISYKIFEDIFDLMNVEIPEEIWDKN